MLLSSAQESSNAAKEEIENEIVKINTKSAIIFVFTASTFLVLLYLFMSTWFIWVLIILFCIGAVEVFYFSPNSSSQLVTI